MDARGSIEQTATQAVGTFQSAPSVTSGAMPGPSAPSQEGQSGSIPRANSVYAVDSRELRPSTWDEVYVLQDALEPSIRSFTRITARTPPLVSGSPWLSYDEQLQILQRESDRCWGADQRPGAPPKLAKLAAWEGGILMVGKAGFRITEEMTEEFTHKSFHGNKHCDGSLSWYQDTFCEQAHDEAERMLSAADARREGFRAQAVEGQEQQDVSEKITGILDSIVARDPEQYLAWLSTMGYFFFKLKDHNPYAFSWEDWCTWKAPRSFEICCRQNSAVRRPPFGPGAIDRTKYGPPGDRPTITLDEAKKGNRRAMEFRDVGNGIEVFMNAKAQYYLSNGEATSREGAAHFHAIRGQDVWFFELTKSFMEVNDDQSRQREVEVEASFCCHRQ